MSDPIVSPVPGDANSRKLWATGSTDIPATKQFVVNATGNIFIATTLGSSDSSGTNVPAAAQKAFTEVSVYFAALTKALAEENKSIFNYSAMEKAISKSGFFIQLNKSEIDFKSKKWGIEFSNDLIQSLLGFSGNLSALGKSLQSMLIGVGKEAITVSAESDETKAKVCSLIFILEYLLGAVSITPILLSVNKEQLKSELGVGPCVKANSKEFNITVDKTMYLFVPPAFIQHAEEFTTAMSNASFDKLVEAIKADISQGASDG
ncbi:hypothetical protein [Gayadomonas joobiniege]|uniref:hypothetical protein n=1 Tax=Gayadomonas joobiniege TaxID=1234606 RepID=UPI000374BD49|nr:hypothetical protein [Gayadomonas joobiniege]